MELLGQVDHAARASAVFTQLGALAGTSALALVLAAFLEALLVEVLLSLRPGTDTE